MESTSIMALIWLSIAVICCRYTFVIWWDAVADYRWTEARDLPHARVLTAIDQLMIHSILLAIQVIAVIIGIVAFVVPVPESAARIVVVRGVIVGGFISIEVLLTVMAIWSRRNWQRILRLMDRAESRAGHPQEQREDSIRV